VPPAFRDFRFRALNGPQNRGSRFWPVNVIQRRSERKKAAQDAADALIRKHGDRAYGISRDHVIAALQAGDNHKRIKWTEIRRILRNRLGRHP
jgi:hypothetical protein